MISMGSPAIFATEYDRSECRIGIVHVGYGAFHRAHQAVYVDDYMERTGDLDWGIAAVNLRNSESEAVADAAAATDGYLLKYTGTTTPTAYRLVRPHVQFADWSRQTAEAEGLIALESVHAVTITVTESGYYLDEAGRLNLDDAVIRAEVSGGTPQSVYGYLAAGLGRRHAAGGGSLTIMCRDNIAATDICSRQVCGLSSGCRQGRSCRMGGSECHVPLLHGRPDHAAHNRGAADGNCRPVPRAWCQPDP